MSGPTATATAYRLADLDQQLADAHTRLRAARDACTRSPTAQTIAAVHQAVADRDALLDQRFAIQRRR